jgi:nitrogen fixation-related uncharacterized protein
MIPLAAAQTGLLFLWVAFAAVALAGIVAVIVWAVRSGQFANQDRARYLPLESGIPDEPKAQEEARDASP